MKSTAQKDVKAPDPFTKAVNAIVKKPSPENVLMESFRAYRGLVHELNLKGILMARDEKQGQILQSLRHGLNLPDLDLYPRRQIIEMLTEIAYSKSASKHINMQAVSCIVEEIDPYLKSVSYEQSIFMNYKLADNFKALQQIKKKNPDALKQNAHTYNTLASIVSIYAQHDHKLLDTTDAMDVLWFLEKEGNVNSSGKAYVWDNIVQHHVDTLSFKLKKTIPENFEEDYFLKTHIKPFGVPNEYENTWRYGEIKKLSLALRHALNTYKLTSPTRTTDDIHLSEEVADTLKVSYLSTGSNIGNAALLNVYWNKCDLMTVIGNNVYSPYAAIDDEKTRVLDDFCDVLKGKAKRAAPYREQKPA